MYIVSAPKLYGRLAWMCGLSSFALLRIVGFAATAENDARDAPTAIRCEVRYHFRERLEGARPGEKQYSSPSYEKETLAGGRVAHLPYRFQVTLGEKKPSMLEINILDAEGKTLSGYPKTIPYAYDPANPTTQEFDIPVGPELARNIEKTLLAKHQQLTQVQLVVLPPQ
jgi:hypothetical protein